METAMKTCPKCSARHDDEVITCDCGHTFLTQSEIAKTLKKNHRDFALPRIIIGVSALSGAALLVYVAYSYSLWIWFPIGLAISSLFLVGIGELIHGVWRYLRNL
jgi:hypothetical protein